MQDPGAPATGRCDQVQDHRPVDRPGLQVGGPQLHCLYRAGQGGGLAGAVQGARAEDHAARAGRGHHAARV